jgi:FkbM family methyltransferase
MLQRALGLYEKEKMNAVLRMLKPGATFVDIGGNVGDYAILAAHVVGDSGKVICFEPAPDNCHWIEKSVELNGYANVRLCRTALSDSAGQASLYLGARCGFHTLLKDQPERQAGVIQVPIQTLDEALHQLGCAAVDMIKIDVEGAELEVLKGALGTLKMNSNVILLLELHPGMGVDSIALCNFLRSEGFSLFEERFPFNTPLEINSHVRELIARRTYSGAPADPFSC